MGYDSLKSTGDDPKLPAPDITADGLRQRMEALRATLLGTAELALVPTANSPVSADVQVVVEAIASTHSEQPHGTFRSGTCPICSAQTQAIFDLFAHWQYMLARDELAQRAFILTHGFCSVHTWQFQQIASPQGVCEGYAPLIEAVVAELRRLFDEAPEQAAVRVEALLSGTETCAACRVLHETETEQIGQFLTQMATPQGRQRYSRSEGSCLPHLHAALVTSSDGEVVQFLLQEQVRHLEEISEDMRTYTLKRDALRRGLLNTQEENAWRRTLVQLVGERTVATIGKRNM
jgi:hypothetical protein